MYRRLEFTQSFETDLVSSHSTEMVQHVHILPGTHKFPSRLTSKVAEEHINLFKIAAIASPSKGICDSESDAASTN